MCVQSLNLHNYIFHFLFQDHKFIEKFPFVIHRIPNVIQYNLLKEIQKRRTSPKGEKTYKNREEAEEGDEILRDIQDMHL